MNDDQIQRTQTRKANMKRITAHILVVVVGLVAFAIMPGTALALLPITSFDFAATNANGGPSNSSGGHPFDVSTTFSFPGADDGSGNILPAESVRNFVIDLPPGLVGNGQALPQCTEDLLAADAVNPNGACDPESQVGYVELTSGINGLPPFYSRLYNMKPPGGMPAEFGFNVQSVTVHIVPTVRTGSDYGITMTVKDLPQVLPFTATTVTFWGVPADRGHDGYRAGCLTIFGPSGSCPSAAPRVPFITNPSTCLTSYTVSAKVDTWADTGNFATASSSNEDSGANPVGLTGCERLPFKPSVTVDPGSRTAGSPTGLEVNLRVPQTDSPDGQATATLDRAVVTLPKGMAVSPSSADGLGACSPAQIGLDNDATPSCPDNAKIGSVKIQTPLLADPLDGSIYLAQQDNNPFHSLLALYVVASADGVLVKLAGHIEADPVTGQLKTTFDHNPQLPFSLFTLNFKDGPRAALSNPTSCGTYTTTAELTPYGGGPVVSSSDSFSINSGCGGGFRPTFSAGTLNPLGHATTGFTMNLGRTDSDAELGSIAMTLPAGVLGNLSTVPLCADVAAGAGTCDAASQVGTTEVGSGPGSNPFHLGGKVYLTGPYKGAPFGLSVVVPAIAGPFDLGTVVVRAAVSVDPHTAALSIASDTFPTILRGIPLRLRTINVTVDRPGFMFNASSCVSSQITAAITSTSGGTATTAVPYQPTNCATLGYAPKLAMTLTGKGQTTDDKHPGLVAHLATRAADANSKKVSVALPLSMALDPDNANALCEPTDAAAYKCPAASIVGHAKAVSILHVPLESPVYFVRGERKDPRSGRIIKTLPKLSIPLRGEGVLVDVGANSEVIDDRLVTTFDNLPDAPFSSFDLTIDGGKHGILVVSGTDICKANQESDASFGGQNGKVATQVVPMATPCSLAIKSSSHTPSVLKLVVGGLGAGKVSVSGPGLTKTSRTLSGATVATLTPKFNRATKRTLARHRSVRTRVTVSFTPKGAKKARVTRKTLTIHG